MIYMHVLYPMPWIWCLVLFTTKLKAVNSLIFFVNQMPFQILFAIVILFQHIPGTILTRKLDERKKYFEDKYNRCFNTMDKVRMFCQYGW